MFEDIYDSIPVEDEQSKIDKSTGILHVENLNVQSYQSWIYLDLHKGVFTDTIDIPTTLTGEWDGRSGISYQHGLGAGMSLLELQQTDAQIDAQDWDIAIHHFDIKTNRGAAYESEYTELSQVPESASAFANARFEEDVWSDRQVIYNLDGMLNYDIGYQNSYVNPVLSRAATMDFTTPPPVYGMSDKVFIIRLKDGTHVAFKLYNYINKRGTKGYLTFDIKTLRE